MPRCNTARERSIKKNKKDGGGGAVYAKEVVILMREYNTVY
jgi:predicted outer membrane repeat protein